MSESRLHFPMLRVRSLCDRHARPPLSSSVPPPVTPTLTRCLVVTNARHRVRGHGVGRGIVCRVVYSTLGTTIVWHPDRPRTVDGGLGGNSSVRRGFWSTAQHRSRVIATPTTLKLSHLHVVRAHHLPRCHGAQLERARCQEQQVRSSQVVVSTPT